MSDKEKKISKLKRRFSKKPVQTKENVVNFELPAENVKSSTLPVNMSLHQQQNEGLINKLKRRFHFGSKGKYDFKSLFNSTTKPHWMRRKSDDSQLRDSESPAELGADGNTLVTKSHSVKTHRKAQSDKEEVILIRKDNRVSVLCRTENGEKPEVIFTNVDISDEDSSGAWAKLDEDPYATIKSVQQEIVHKTETNVEENSVSEISPEPGPVQHVPLLLDDYYPYSQINPDRVNKSLPNHSRYPEAKFFNSRASSCQKSRKEPDYETLDEVKEKKIGLNEIKKPKENLNKAVNNLLDPDYESLEDVKLRCLETFGQPSSTHSVTSAKDSTVDNTMNTQCCKQKDLSLESCKLKAGISQPKLQEDAATFESQKHQSDIEECIYDNPNVIIRKHKSEAMVPMRRGQTLYEAPSIKTPAEEELVEKLSSLLAPPLPLRNYQKDEVKGETGLVRHSWASQTSRPLEFIDSHYHLHDAKRTSPFNSSHDIDQARFRDFTLRSKKSDHNDIKLNSKTVSQSPSLNEFLDNFDKPGTLSSLTNQCGVNLPSYKTKIEYEKSSLSNYILNMVNEIVEDAYQRAVSVKQDKLDHSASSSTKINGQIGLKVSPKHQPVSNQTDMLASTNDKMLSNKIEETTKVQLPVMMEKSAMNLIHNDRKNNEVSKSPNFYDDSCIDYQSKNLIIEQDDSKTKNANSLSPDPIVNGPLHKGEMFRDKVEMYKQQGARPKFKPLLIPSQILYLKDSQTNTSSCVSGQGDKRLLQEQLSDDSHTWDEAMSPSFCDLNFHDSISENFEHLPSSQMHKSEPTLESDSSESFKLREHIQEVVYLHSNSDTEEDLSGDKSIVSNVIRNLSDNQVAKPVLFANLRLLENVVCGKFTTSQSLDMNYFHNGIFKWGRYFSGFMKDRKAVEKKLKIFFNFMRHMLLTQSELSPNNELEIAQLQENFDFLQRKIEKQLFMVQDLPTFQGVRLHLLKTEKLDHSVPDFSQWLNSGKKNMYESKRVEVTIDKLQHLKLHDKEVIRDDLHSDDCVVDGSCPLGCLHSPCLSPVKPKDILTDFLNLSICQLTCSYCGVEEESDSEDEMIALETYAKTVSCAPLMSSPSKVNHTNNIVLCRALYGELAYTAQVRKSRSLSKSILVPGPNEECLGAECHISWNNWCSMDAIIKKLIPHISPRLDFQYLLKTYAEFKFFILKERKRNFKLRGCFTKKHLQGEDRCCRFEEFVFLKLLRNELQYFAYVLRRLKCSEALFLEEPDVGCSLLNLLKIVLRNVHKMKSSLSREKHVGQSHVEQFSPTKHWKDFRHSAFTKWQSEIASDGDLCFDVKAFHLENLYGFHSESISNTLKDWMTPQEYMQDPNVLVPCRTVIGHQDSRGIELTSMKGTEELRPLQEREDFFESLQQLQLQPWYWGPISYEQAAMILKDREDGSFLVRDSSDQKYLLSLSFTSLGEVHHTRIEHAKGLFSFWSQPESLGKAKICEFIEKSIQNSKDGRFLYFLRPSARGTPPLPIRLLCPVSRNFRVATLKHLARFVVRQTVRNDHLELLPVPEKVKRYLKNRQYYVEILDEDEWAFDGDYVKS